MVVDDDPEWLDFLSRAIGSQYPVLSATNGEDAVRRAQRARPDVIILDVMMSGGRDGFAVFSELQNDPRTQNIPVLMLSEVNRKTGLDFGAENMNRYLGKAPAAFLERAFGDVNFAVSVLSQSEVILREGGPGGPPSLFFRPDGKHLSQQACAACPCSLFTNF